jgi:hypothetical protein
MEPRLMDEHLYLTRGESITFDHDFVDDNLSSLTRWTSKHNDYATREAVQIMNARFSKESQTNVASQSNLNNARRWYKDNLYLRLPKFIRCFLYFNFRYWIRLGFLDGKAGLVWHVLQGFWYRFLVDAKILQIEGWIKNDSKEFRRIVKKFNITL